MLAFPFPLVFFIIAGVIAVRVLVVIDLNRRGIYLEATAILIKTVLFMTMNALGTEGSVK